MAAVTDLTWDQLEAALGSQGIISWDATDGIVIKVGQITGDTYSGTSDQGVIEFMHKLREACSSAQSTANLNKSVGERLAAFPPASASAPVDGYVTVTQSIISRIPLNMSTIIGSVI